MKSFKILSLIATLSLFAHLGADDYSGVPERGWGKNSSNRNQSSQKQQQAQTKQRDLFLVDVGAVYLRPYQGGTDFAQLIDTADRTVVGSTSDSEPYGTNKALGFEFDWGVRAGIGYQFVNPRQTLEATYLYLGSNAHKSTSSDYTGDISTANTAVLSNFLESTGGGGGGFGHFFQSASSKWHLNFNMLDFAFGKKFPKRGCMTFEPFVGAKGIYLTENQTNSYVAPPGVLGAPSITAILKQKMKFQGAGVMGGLNLDWSFNRWLSFVGSVDAALLYSSVKTTRTSNDTIPSILWIGSSHDVKGTPVLDGSFALRGVYCWKSGRFIDLKIGFEEHYIFQTMKHTLFNSDSSTDLSLMGWFATLGVGF